MNKEIELNCISCMIQTIIVEKSEGTIQYSEVIKDKKIFKNKSIYFDYNLKKIDCNHSLYYNVVKDMKKSESLQRQDYKFSDKNFIEKFFFKENKTKRFLSKIIELTDRCSWIIVSSSFLSIIEKLPNFVPNLETENKILLGNSENISIYSNPNLSSKEILFGSYDSFQIILNEKTQDYILLEKLPVKLLKVI